jgi:hypothetical protein
VIKKLQSLVLDMMEKQIATVLLKFVEIVLNANILIIFREFVPSTTVKKLQISSAQLKNVEKATMIVSKLNNANAKNQFAKEMPENYVEIKFLDHAMMKN